MSPVSIDQAMLPGGLTLENYEELMLAASDWLNHKTHSIHTAFL